ncbi:MAG: DUF3429 domain-containing protein [Burkholderiales bacterium]
MYERTPLQALILGFAGLIPFFALALAAWVSSPDNAALATRYLAYYGAVILSFVGALHWGFAMALPIDAFERGRIYGWSVCPALAAWFALLLPTAGGLALIAVMFLLHYRMDRRVARLTVLPAWYLKLRLWLTLGAVAALLAALPRAV